MFKSFKMLILLSVSFLLVSFVSVSAQEEDGISIGGAFRYNFFVRMYESDLNVGDIQKTWDTWRLNVSGLMDGFLLDFEYRFYPVGQVHFIQRGWVGYRWNDNTQLELGVTQVPFGNLPYASHSYFFSTAYYVGLEDDYDMGVKVTHTVNNFDLALAYFIQSEPHGTTAIPDGNPEAARYSYDLIPVEGQSNEERNQVNARVAYNLPLGLLGGLEVGVSAQYGQIFNSVVADEDAWSDRYAAAFHIDADIGQFNLLANTILYNYNAVDDQGNSLETVTKGAYGWPYSIASKAMMYTVGLAYTLPFQIGPATVTVYNNYTFTDKDNDQFENTQQNVLGASVGAGPIFAYIDLASGYNHPWLTDFFGVGLDEGQQDPQWNHRLNINFGYYF
ncbi:hypothetical protein QA601_17190 [Chitinispirillales bacterium ANBcel5]|uniref:hypothetical protein n=1 Tax=Cellulosispirillum alkaliphilum TaxID=3039283 RepID=UPI002A55DC1F|nr:hypothetical protein [Chitinispirillales bacterium ANBcel5]